MKKFSLLFLAMLLMIVTPVHAQVLNDGGGTTPIVSMCSPYFPGGNGTWLLDPETGCNWYLHTDQEFDATPQDCIACHDGIQAGEW